MLDDQGNPIEGYFASYSIETGERIDRYDFTEGINDLDYEPGSRVLFNEECNCFEILYEREHLEIAAKFTVPMDEIDNKLKR